MAFGVQAHFRAIAMMEITNQVGHLTDNDERNE
jgi:hypothetical protein